MDGAVDRAVVDGRPAGSGLGLGLLREEIARVGGEARLTRGEDGGSTMRARIPTL